MSENSIPGDRRYFGRVRRARLPRSSLVVRFQGNMDQAAEAVVLRGYAGNTTNVDRAIEFLRVAERNGQAVPAQDQAAVEALRGMEEEHLARIYLTPRLDRYVDFHRSCVLAWRREAKSDRQDMFTVWLRRYDDDNVAITYRAIDEAIIGAAPATYLGGDLLDDFLDQASSQTGAWGAQAGGNLGNKPWTVRGCGG
jgi:hypothetical protein